MANAKKIIRKAKKGETIRQVAAVPCRLRDGGGVEVMLVTSCDTGRFIVPKGWPMKGKSARKAAGIEARQEAGVVGKVLDEPIGRYSYWKRLSECFVPVEVTVYAFAVSKVAPKWQEAGVRQRAWLKAADAATLVDEPQLAALMDDAMLGETLRSLTKVKRSRALVENGAAA